MIGTLMLAPMISSPPTRRSAEEQARLHAELIDLIEHRMVFNRLLGLKVQSITPQMVLRLEMRPELVGHFQWMFSQSDHIAPRCIDFSVQNQTSALFCDVCFFLARG